VKAIDFALVANRIGSLGRLDAVGSAQVRDWVTAQVALR